MHSPLPDSSALEAGILEDAPPSRLSRVQDNVRNLLRSSMLGSVRSSPRVSTAIASPPVQHTQPAPWRHPTAQVVHSPSVESVSSIDSDSSKASTASQRSTDMLLPATSYHQAVAHHSTMFNNRALAALDRPDLNDSSLASILHSEAKRRQRHAYKRTRHRKADTRRPTSLWLLCVFLGLALSGMVATYVALSTTMSNVSAAFHIIFVLGILLISIGFIHTLARLLIVPYASSRHRGNGRRRRPAHHQASRDHDDHYTPETPVPIHGPEDDVRLDPNEAQPSAAVHQPPEVWVKDSADKAPMPPPAYGRWRGSVRVPAELLQWHAVPAPIHEDMPTVPSPTYEAAATNITGSPPSYKVRATPERTRLDDRAREPEMVEGRGIGL